MVKDLQNAFLFMSTAGFLLFSSLVDLKVFARAEAIAFCTPDSVCGLH
jgi:hypothetical protein